MISNFFSSSSVAAEEHIASDTNKNAPRGQRTVRLMRLQIIIVPI
jgi:hypothetical protein